MSLSVSVTWGGEWLVGQRLTPTLLNSIFQNATFDLAGTISAASMPVGGIDYSWRGATWTVGLPTVAPASGDLVTFWDVSGSIHARCTVGTLLALGSSAPAAVTSVAATDEAVVLISSVEKRVPIRELAETCNAYQMADTSAAATGVLAAADKVLVTKGGTQGTATVSDLTGSVFVGRSTLAAASVDLDADFLLLYDTSASAVKKVAPRSLQTGLSAFVTFDGRSEIGTYITRMTGQNLTEDLGADTVTFNSGHGITTGEVRQGWWATGCPLTSTPAMAIETAYWIRATSGTAIAFYLTKAAAEADTGRINLTADSGSSAWTFYFWDIDPTANSGGVIGVNGIVVMDQGTQSNAYLRGKYRIFWKSAATLTHPVVCANLLYGALEYYPQGVTYASVRSSEPTYCDVWSINAEDAVAVAGPVHVMMQT